MRVDIKTSGSIFPMPVLLIATYNEDGSVDVMNAAWGTLFELRQVLLNLSETHKTVKNIKLRGAFTITIADAKHVAEADYFGVVSGNNTKNKFEFSRLTAFKSSKVDAPIIKELPLSIECVYDEKASESTGFAVVGNIVGVNVDDSILKDGKVDIDALEAIAYDAYTNGYYKVKGRVGTAFCDGVKFKERF